MKKTINIHIDKLVDKIEINNPNETGSLHERIEEVILDALTEAIFSPEPKNTEAHSSRAARQNNTEKVFHSLRSRCTTENRAFINPQFNHNVNVSIDREYIISLIREVLEERERQFSDTFFDLQEQFQKILSKQQKDEKLFQQDSDSSYKNLKAEENKTEVTHKGHILITADSIKELQAKVNYENEMLGENESQAVVYSAVISTFSLTK
ncbi:hypothetical protein [Elizabethkingia miricola]|uniref:hypothetical protein n=1 Tax=Elizabethkingia miricola TaxID=172045 RepID=UPI000B35BBC0|nr:hypothetical protein [Elizabethkingia miricola]